VGDHRQAHLQQPSDLHPVLFQEQQTILSTLFAIVLQDPPLPWVTADRRILNPAIHVGTQLDKLVQGAQR
jgi:hypothetical protein